MAVAITNYEGKLTSGCVVPVGSVAVNNWSKKTKPARVDSLNDS
jgi:hypothetical protein